MEIPTIQSLTSLVAGEQTESSDSATACIAARDRLAYAILEHQSTIPPGVKIYTCANTSPRDSHSWLLVERAGEQYVWDSSRTKLPSSDPIPLAQAAQIWSGFNNQYEKVQIFPDIEQ